MLKMIIGLSFAGLLAACVAQPAEEEAPSQTEAAFCDSSCSVRCQDGTSCSTSAKKGACATCSCSDGTARCQTDLDKGSSGGIDFAIDEYAD